MGMLEKIKMRISVAAFVLNAISMIERGVLATLQSPLVLVFPLPVENSITQSLKQSSRHGRTRPRTVWSVGLSVLPRTLSLLGRLSGLGLTVLTLRSSESAALTGE